MLSSHLLHFDSIISTYKFIYTIFFHRWTPLLRIVSHSSVRSESLPSVFFILKKHFYKFAVRASVSDSTSYTTQGSMCQCISPSFSRPVFARFLLLPRKYPRSRAFSFSFFQFMRFMVPFHLRISHSTKYNKNVISNSKLNVINV